MKRTRWWTATVFLLTIVACGRGESQAPSEAMATTDTLVGLRLGMLLPDVRETLTERMLLLDCIRTVKPMWCEVRFMDAEDLLGAFYLSFDEGRLSQIMYFLSQDWEYLPLDTLLTRLSAYGKPVHEETSDNGVTFTWSGPPDSTMFMLRCGSRRYAKDCAKFVRFGTLADLEDE